jgi:hypothetical protein
MGLVTSRMALAVVAVLAAMPAAADEVLLRGGGKITGVVVEKTKDTVVLEAGGGRISVPMSRVLRIVDPGSGSGTYRERAAALGPRDVDGWAALARWAAEQGLATQSREAWKKVLVADPFHPEANAAVGQAQPDRTWKATEDEYRAQGYEEFEGRWVTRAERRALLRERAAEEAREQEAREANDRVREAEARAREAESRARDAEATAQSGDGGGWNSGADVPPSLPRRRPTEVYITEPPPPPDPPPSRPPSSIGTTSPPPKPPTPTPPPPKESTGGAQKRPD